MKSRKASKPSPVPFSGDLPALLALIPADALARFRNAETVARDAEDASRAASRAYLATRDPALLPPREEARAASSKADRELRAAAEAMKATVPAPLRYRVQAEICGWLDISI